MSFAFGIGIGTQNNQGEWLEVFYQQPIITPEKELIDVVETALDYKGGNQAIQATAEQLVQFANALRQIGASDQASLAEKVAGSKRPVVVTILETDDTASSTPEVYLKLHLISHRQAKPHGVKLDGIFGLLPNLAWTVGAPAQSPPGRPLTGNKIRRQVPTDDRLRGTKRCSYRRHSPCASWRLCG